MKKSLFLLLFLAGPLLLLCGQKTLIHLSLKDFPPTQKVEGSKAARINVVAASSSNLLKQYDANPFEKPVIVPAEDLQQSLSAAFLEYISGVGLNSNPNSQNQINLKTVICAINYLSGKGWTATAKFDIEVIRNNNVILYESIGGYEIEGGNEGKPALSGDAMNKAIYSAFEKVNWNQLAAKLANENSSEPAAHPVAIQSEAEVRISGRYYALIIAIEDYQYINKLDKPIRDATRLQQILASSYSFGQEDILFLKNPTRAQIIDKLDYLVSVITEEDNLLIFYAGHGYWDEERITGYWLPVDAKRTSTANWLRNSTIQEYIGDIKSRHTLLIADACFGGGIFKMRKAFEDAPSAINQVYELNSRKAITSGMLNEVPDRSVFFEYLIRRLQINKQKYISSLQLFSSFRIAVMNNSDNVPQYGTIQKTGDEGGDFVFVKK